MVFIKKHFSTIILAVLLAVILFVPNAKAFLLKGILGTGLFNASTKQESLVTKPDALSTLVFTDNNGNTININELKGKAIFINFWATWCPPCVAEMGGINALYNRLKDNPKVIFILADADGELNNSALFLQKHQYSLPLYKLSGNISADLFSGTLPTTLVIDANGQLVKKHEGLANYNTDGMVEFLLKAAGGISN